MKKFLSLVSLLITAALLLTGCGGKNTGDNNSYAPSVSVVEPSSSVQTPSESRATVPANDNIVASDALGTAVYSSPPTSVSTVQPQKDEKEFRGMWIAIYELSPKNTSISEAEYKAKIDKMMENLMTLGITDVFAQVRANCDSIYPSKYFKNYYAFERDGKLIFDALKIIVSSAHGHGIKIHAWINPYRISAKDSVSDNDPIFRSVKKSDVYISGKRAHLKPVSENAKRLVLNGVREILAYDVDGIHIDDYFYPTTDEKIDKEEYKSYKSSGGSLSLSDWRRANVSSLVSSLYSLVKSSGGNRIFSISPGGDIDKNQNYLYADVKLWCSTPGYADMIIPQIYFGFENERQPFKRCLDGWEKIRTCDGVKLAVGLAPYKANCHDEYAGSGENEWKQNSDIIKREVEYIRTKKCVGFALFSYHHVFVDNNLINTEMQNLKSVL